MFHIFFSQNLSQDNLLNVAREELFLKGGRKNMKIYKKYLVIGLMILFVGAGMLPTISSDTATKINDMKVLYYSDSPVVTITVPEGKWARGYQWVNGTASDPEGYVVLVQVAIIEEGEILEEDDWVNASDTTNWYYLWDTFGYVEYYVLWNISARAIDNDGEWGYATSITVEVDNTPPVIVFFKPRNRTLTILNKVRLFTGGKTIVIGPIGGVDVQVYATDPHHGEEYIKDQTIIFHWDGNVYTLIWSATGLWECKWNVWRHGWFTIYVECQDKAGNLAETDHFDAYYFNLG